jgi:hypothetical protein
MNLDDEKALELYRKGFLAWIYAHLFSLSNFRPMGQLIVDAGDKEKEEAVVES